MSMKMTLVRTAVVVVLCLSSPFVVVVQQQQQQKQQYQRPKQTQQQQQLQQQQQQNDKNNNNYKLRRVQQDIGTFVPPSPMDGRWKSTKLTQKQKAAMGLFPPPGEQWPDDPPELLAKHTSVGGGTVSVIDTEDEEEAEMKEVEEAPALDEIDTSDGEDDAGGDDADADDGYESPEDGGGDDAGGENGGDEETDDMVADMSESNEGQAGEEQQQPEEPPKQTYRRGTFLRYEPSKWEQGWADNIEALTTQTAICRTLLHGKHQTARTHDFMELICPAWLDGDLSHWCYYHDHNHFMWYNAENRDTFEVYVDTTPLELDGVDPPPLQLVDYSQEKFEGVASKMIYRDYDTGEEYVEYIEPLVAQLKFPLTECLDDKPLLADFASFVLPPPGISSDRRTLLYDVGSADWSRLEYLVEEWKVRGAEFEFIVSFATNGDEVDDAFLSTLPEKHASHVFRNYFELVDDQNLVTTPSKVFVPVQIHDEAQENDYVVLKLDRTNAKLKESYVNFILKNKIHVDELIWEINASGNYVMKQWMDLNLQFDEISSLSLPDAYKLLTQLREQGVRAHSWI